MHFSMVQYGLPEVRMLMKGSYILCGINLEQLGGSYAAAVQQMTRPPGAASFVEDVFSGKEGTFAYVHELVGEVIVVPPGFLTVTLGHYEEDPDLAHTFAEVSRWSLLKPSQRRMELVLKGVGKLQDAFEEIKNDEVYKSWREIVTGRLLTVEQQ